WGWGGGRVHPRTTRGAAPARAPAPSRWATALPPTPAPPRRGEVSRPSFASASPLSFERLHGAVRVRHRQCVAREREFRFAIARLRRDRGLAGDILHRPLDVVDETVTVGLVAAGMRSSPPLPVLIHRVGEREMSV